MINKYTGQEAVQFLGCEASYGYHTTVYETGDFKTSRFSLEIKEYRNSVLVQTKFSGCTPLGAAGPHGFELNIEKAGNWIARVEQVANAALSGDFSDFPNPVQVNRSSSISKGEHVVRDWVADCGSAQDFAQKCFELNR